MNRLHIFALRQDKKIHTHAGLNLMSITGTLLHRTRRRRRFPSACKCQFFIISRKTCKGLAFLFFTRQSTLVFLPSPRIIIQLYSILVPHPECLSHMCIIKILACELFIGFRDARCYFPRSVFRGIEVI